MRWFLVPYLKIRKIFHQQRKIVMARACHFCNKTPLLGHNVSHANNKTVKRSFPNLQSVRAIIAGSVKKVRACTRCIRSGVVIKAAKGKKTVAKTA